MQVQRNAIKTPAPKPAPKAIDAKKAVGAAWGDIQTVQARLTRELRPEDGIVNLVSTGPKTVSVVLKAHQPYADADIERAVQEHLAKHGIKNAAIDFIRPAINIRPVGVVVAAAWDAIEQVQARLTTDIRPEDDIVNLVSSGRDVRVVLRAHTNSSDAEIRAAVEKHPRARASRARTSNSSAPPSTPSARPSRPSSPRTPRG